MKELLQAVLEDSSSRDVAALSVVASQAASEFAPWAAGEL